MGGTLSDLSNMYENAYRKNTIIESDNIQSDNIQSDSSSEELCCDNCNVKNCEEDCSDCSDCDNCTCIEYDCCEKCDEMSDKIEFLEEMLKNLEQRIILLEKSKVE